MKFFVDTANIDDIRDLAATGLLDGVTTNPSLVAKSGRPFADVVRDSLRATDTAGRMGGEEFAMVLPGTDLEMAKGFAERLRRVLARCPPQHNGVAVPITVSIGVAGLRPTDTSAATALARADEALFRAKDMGRDRVLGTA